jgi:hypothetical protein
MQARQPLQFLVVERLDTEADAVHAGGAERAQQVARGALGIGLERDLGVRRDVERAAAGREDPLHVVGREQRRRAAAEENRVGGGPLAAFPRSTNLGDERVDVPTLQGRIEQTAIEIAVVADRRAERDVDVQA